MSEGYSTFVFDTSGYEQEVLLALLSEWPFDSFLEERNQLTAYILTSAINSELIDYIAECKTKYFSDYTTAILPDTNWNAVWENSFSPVAINEYCYIRATFHPLPEPLYKHIVTIAPKMAFGTGHHATTYMMLEAMSQLDFQDKAVLDFGCGTGILSIVAAMEGAREVLGIDIQPESVENSIEHALLNGVEKQCKFLQGELEQIKNSHFDIILANINLKVIHQHLDELKSILHPGGFLLLSGIMVYDRAYVDRHLYFPPLEVMHVWEKDEWLQITLSRPDQ